ncbi:MAG: hypothetical protein ACRC0X_09140, partial [Brevinema sp.]
FNVSDSVPHVTLYLGKDSEAKDLGPMMEKAAKVKWNPTINPLIFHSDNLVYIKILYGDKLVGTPQEIVLSCVSENQFPVAEIAESKFQAEMERLVSPELWSQHETDVGLVKSANSVIVPVKPNMLFPRIRQYPLTPEAEAGIRETINGLLKAEVLVETSSYCNIPIFPVKKAGKKK